MGVNVLNNAYNVALKIIKFFVVVLSVILVASVFANVVSRYFLHAAFAWSEELARFLFIWLTFLGAILANAKDEHMKLDMLIKFAPKKVGYILNVLADVIMVLILGFLFKGGLTLVTESLDWTTPALEISYGLIYTIVPVSCAILFIQMIVKLLNDIKVLFTGEKPLSELSKEVKGV